jgi:predicted RNA polymerase sigma factor
LARKSNEIEEGEAKWRRGFHFLEKSSMGNELSEYHLEAGIASLHCAAPSYQKTEWGKILELYDMLDMITPSPMVALYRGLIAGILNRLLRLLVLV